MMMPTFQLPWSRAEDWNQAILSLEMSMDRAGERLARSRKIAAQIGALYERVESQLDAVCTLTCPDCPDNCCCRATVWYDLRDLLTIYFINGHFPAGQIERKTTNQCCHLLSKGCRLPRVERPFLCTWYICTDQRKILDACSGLPVDHSLLATLQQIKQLRYELEEDFVKAVC